MDIKPKTIYCPCCSRKNATWDGKSSNIITVKCRNCRRMTVFEPSTGKTISKPLPNRVTASGMTFI